MDGIIRICSKFGDPWPVYKFDLVFFKSCEGISVKRLVSSTHYDEKVNTYKAKCGGSLEMWETSGWIDKIDPYGKFWPKLI